MLEYKKAIKTYDLAKKLNFNFLFLDTDTHLWLEVLWA